MHGNKIANYWMHNAFVNFGDTKMSKSLGNVVYAKDMIEQYGGAVTRLVILNTHYRQPRSNRNQPNLINNEGLPRRISSSRC